MWSLDLMDREDWSKIIQICKDTHEGLVICMFYNVGEMGREANTEFGLDG